MSEIEGGDAKVVRTAVVDGEVVQTEHVLTEADVKEMDSSIERVMDDVKRGRAEGHTAAPADPYDLQEHRKDVLRGRDQDLDGYWKSVMEHYGFNWIEPVQLDAVIGPERFIPSKIADVHDRYGREIYNNRLYWTRNHTEGQWRPDIGRRRPHSAIASCSFTMADLVSMFGEPKAFDEWARLMIEKWNRTKGKIKRAQRRR